MKHAHLPFEELPLLADDDHTGYLKKKSFKNLDPTLRTSQGHIGWVLIRFYGACGNFLVLEKKNPLKEWILTPQPSILNVAPFAFTMIVAVLTQCLVEFLHPIAILNLLRYVETNGEGATIRPWCGTILLLSSRMASHQFISNLSCRFWVLALFFKSFIETVTSHRYLYLVVS